MTDGTELPSLVSTFFLKKQTFPISIDRFRDEKHGAVAAMELTVLFIISVSTK